MIYLRKQLEAELAAISGVTLALFKDTDLLCMTYNGKDIAHFHNGLSELDIRIPTKFVKRHGLGEPYTSANHPNRSKKSIWRAIPYRSESDVNALVELVKTLVVEEYQAT